MRKSPKAPPPVPAAPPPPEAPPAPPPPPAPKYPSAGEARGVIRGYYNEILARPGSRPELDDYSSKVSTGALTLADVRSALYGTDEYAALETSGQGFAQGDEADPDSPEAAREIARLRREGSKTPKPGSPEAEALKEKAALEERQAGKQRGRRSLITNAYGAVGDTSAPQTLGGSLIGSKTLGG